MKKRVERLSSDPTTVVTTYEGTHTHPTPLTSRGRLSLIPEMTGGGGAAVAEGLIGGGGAGAAGPSSFFLPPMPQYQQDHQQHQQQQPCFQDPTLPPMNFNVSSSSFVRMFIQESGYCPLPPPPPPPSSSFMDNGLLEDIVPSRMLIKEPKKE